MAAAAGYTVGSIYHVFGSYDALLLHINAETLDSLHESVTAALTKTNRRDRLLTLAEAYYAFARKEYQMWLCLFEYRLSPETEIPDWYRAKLKALFGIIEEQLMPLCAGDRRHCRRHAKIFWAGVHGICALSLSGRLEVVGSDPAPSLIETFTSTYSAGLKASYKA